MLMLLLSSPQPRQTQPSPSLPPPLARLPYLPSLSSHIPPLSHSMVGSRLSRPQPIPLFRLSAPPSCLSRPLSLVTQRWFVLHSAMVRPSSSGGSLPLSALADPLLTRGRLPMWSIADLICKLKSLKHGQIKAADELGFRSITTSIDHIPLGYREESTTKSIQNQVVHALALGERGKASSLLLDLGRTKNSLRPDLLVDILKYCVRSPDPLFAMETWRIMEEKEIGFNNISCLLMTQALCKGGYLEEAFDFIKCVQLQHGMNLSLIVYNSFLGACSKMCNIILANQCLDLMEHRMLGKNEVTYTELLELAVCQQNPFAVHEIWKDYIKHYSPSILYLQKFIHSFTRLRELNSACQILQYMVDLALQGNTSVESIAKGRLHFSRLDIPVPSKIDLQKFLLDKNNEQPIPLKVDTFAGSNLERSTISFISKEEVEGVGILALDGRHMVPTMKVLKSSFGDVIHACAKNQNSRLAEQLILQMQKLGIQPSSHTYDGFLRAVIFVSGISEGMKVLKVMQQKNLKPYNSTFATLSMACCEVFELDLAEAFLDQILNFKDPRPYNLFLKACDAMDEPERAIRMLAKMKQLKIQPNIRTYELLFSLFGNVNAPYEDGNMLSQVDSAKRIKAIEMDMAKNGVQHSHASMKNLLKALGAEGMITELIQYLSMAEDLFSCGNTYVGLSVYNMVLHSLVEAKESHLVIEIFKKMKSGGFRLNAATYTTMIDYCSITRHYSSAYAFVSMMLRDGFYPETATYTALIKVLLDGGNFDEALNLLDQGNKEGIRHDLLLYNTILHKACDKGRINVTELVVEQMHRAKIKPDASTCHYVFRTYVKCNLHNTAIEALQVLSMRMICEEEAACQEKKLQFEDDFILSEDQGAESRILEFLGGPEEKTAFALLNLRWCAILGFPICWSPNETLWARRLSTKYDTMQSIVQ